MGLVVGVLISFSQPYILALPLVCQQDFFQDFASGKWHLVKSCVQFQISWSSLNRSFIVPKALLSQQLATIFALVSLCWKMLSTISDCTKILLLQFMAQIVKSRANRRIYVINRGTISRRETFKWNALIKQIKERKVLWTDSLNLGILWNNIKSSLKNNYSCIKIN